MSARCSNMAKKIDVKVDFWLFLFVLGLVSVLAGKTPKAFAPGEDRTHDLQIALLMWLWDWRATYCAKAPTQSHEVLCQNLTNENHPKIQGNDEWNSLFQKKNNFLETDYKHAIWI